MGGGAIVWSIFFFDSPNPEDYHMVEGWAYSQVHHWLEFELVGKREWTLRRYRKRVGAKVEVVDQGDGWTRIEPDYGRHQPHMVYELAGGKRASAVRVSTI